MTSETRQPTRCRIVIQAARAQLLLSMVPSSLRMLVTPVRRQGLCCVALLTAASASKGSDVDFGREKGAGQAQGQVQGWVDEGTIGHEEPHRASPRPLQLRFWLRVPISRN